MTDIVPTVIPQDLADLERRAQAIAQFSNRLHLDIDDGVFTPHLSWPYEHAGVYDSARVIRLPAGVVIEAHLMVQEPRQIGLDLIRAGARSIIAHVEICAGVGDAEEMLTQWRAAGAAEVGLAVLIDTPLWDLERCVSWCEVVQVMSIAKIGAYGESFDTRAIERVKKLRQAHPDLAITVDGGITEETAGELSTAGATRLCVGSAIMKTPDPAEAFHQLQNVVSGAR